MNRPEEREPSPGSARPWIIFSGEGVRTMMLDNLAHIGSGNWIAGYWLKKRWGAAEFEIVDAMRDGHLHPKDATGQSLTPDRCPKKSAMDFYVEECVVGGQLTALRFVDLALFRMSEVLSYEQAHGLAAPEPVHQGEGVEEETQSGILSGSSFSSPVELLQYLRSKGLDEDEIRYRMYHNGRRTWDLTQWKVDCLVAEEPFPPSGPKGEAGRDKHKASYLRSEKRYLGRTKNPE